MQRALSDEQVREIRHALKELSIQKVATLFNVSFSTVRSIKVGATYQDVKDVEVNHRIDAAPFLESILGPNIHSLPESD